MQQTEKYNLFFYGNNSCADIGRVENIWNQCANQVFQKTDVYVESIVEPKNLLCARTMTECTNNKLACVNVVCVRNPVMLPDARQYKSALKEVFDMVKHLLGNPYVVIEIQDVQVGFFTPQELK